MSPRRVAPPRPGQIEPTGAVIEVTAPFLVDALQDGPEWVGRCRVDGHVLFVCAASGSQAEAVAEARAALAEHLQLLFTGAADVEHQQRTEKYASLVELEAGRVLRAAGGWSLVTVRVHGEDYVAVFQRDWPGAGQPD